MTTEPVGHRTPASGGFGHGGWWLHTPGDDPRSAQYASAHESHHLQLEESTTFGILTRVVASLSRVEDVGERFVRKGLVHESRRTHEAFASWTPALALGWSRAELAAAYPAYLRDFDVMDSLAGQLAALLETEWTSSRRPHAVAPVGRPSPYLQLHAAHAIARACMQSTALSTALVHGLGPFTLAELRQTERPDVRLSVLRRRPVAPALVASQAFRDRIEETGRGDVVADLVAARELDATMLSPELTAAFEAVNSAVFRVVAAHLNSRGYEVQAYDAQVELGRTALEAAEATAQAPIGLAPPGIDPAPDAAEVHAWRALGSVDAETFSVADPLPAQWLPADTPLSAMVAGIEDPHLFLALRPSHILPGNYSTAGQLERPAERLAEPQNLESGEPTSIPVGQLTPPARDPTRGGVDDAQDVTGFLRRTVLSQDGQLVELLDVTNRFPSTRSDVPTPVVTSVSLSVLATPFASRFAAFLHPEVSTVLIDLPLAPHLRLWLSSNGTRVRHVLLRTEGHGRVVPVLLLRVESDSSKSHLMVKPVSHAAARIVRAGFEELGATGLHLVPDPSLLDDEPELLELTLSHLVGEEVRFEVR